MDINQGQISDLTSITDIFNDYIENTYARFETSPFSYQNRATWFSQFAENSRYQIFVAHEDHHVLGFACSQPYRMFSAFDETVEVTVYLTPRARGNGVGSALYQHLFDALAQQSVHRAVLGIALPNDASVALHKRFGFREIGVFTEYAKKNGQYISSVWLEKSFE